MMSTERPIERVRARLIEATGYTPTRASGDWRCPAHPDDSPSLSVNEGDDGRVLLHCQAGCDFGAVLAALSLEPSDLFAEEGPNPNRPIVAEEYEYVDEEGALLFVVERRVPKDFRQRKPDGHGGWEWKLGDTRRVLYRLPLVIAAIEGELPIFVCEGERDVHALERAGWTATTNPGGAGKWRQEYAEVLRGADVVVIADKDTPGYQHADQVATSVRQLAKRVRIVEAKEGKDVADHLAAGFGVEDFLYVEPQGAEPSEHKEGAELDPAVELRVQRLRQRLLGVDDLANLPPPISLIDDVLMQNSLAVLWGKPGSAKTFVSLDWSASVATGSWWFGRRVYGGPVLYVAAEGAGGLHQRLQAWMTDRMTPIANDQLLVHPDAINLLDPQWADAVIELTRQLTPSLLVVDTLARSMVGGDENAARDMGILIDAADRIRKATGTAVLLVHHDTKEGSTMRGSSALLGAVDTSIECKLDGRALVLKCEKQKDAARFEPIRLGLQPMSDSCVIWYHDRVVLTEERSESEERLLQVCWDLCGTEGLSPSKLESLSEMPHTSFYRAMKALRTDGVLRNVGTESRPRLRPAEMEAEQ